MDKILADTAFTDDKEVNDMPTIELVEHERVSYVKELENYLRELKEMSNSEARVKARLNLIKSNIIREDGEFTEHYRDSSQFDKR